MSRNTLWITGMKDRLQEQIKLRGRGIEIGFHLKLVGRHHVGVVRMDLARFDMEQPRRHRDITRIRPIRLNQLPVIEQL